jgi:hypothetical protein
MMIPPGTPLGPYEILAPIEAGGMSSVYRARDPRLGRQVAIKVLPASSMVDDTLVRRFQREARAAAALQHPNIVAVHDVGETEVTIATPYGAERMRVRYIVQELVDGPSLRHLILQGPIPIASFVDIALGIALGLAAAHEKGLVHRDLKPENVLIDETGRPRITDFGLVHWLQQEGGYSPPTGAHEMLTRSGYVVGTLGYMSPEQARGDPLGPASDIFVYGVVLYELLTGGPPFARDNPDDAFRAVLKARVPPLGERVPHVPPELARVIERCLEKSPSERYASAGEIVHDLERVRAVLGGAPAPARPFRSSGVRRRRREEAAAGYWLASALGVLFAFAGGWAVGYVRSGTPSLPAAGPSLHEWRTEVCAAGARDADAIEAVLSTRADLVAFTAGAADETDVYVVPLRGAAAPRRVSGADGGRAPWLTSARHVLFSSGRAEAKAGIWDAPLDESEPPKLIVDDGEEPALSPDESTLAYVRRRGDLSELWLARRDGLFRRRVLTAQAEWRYPVFTATGGALLVYDIARSGAPFPAGAQLAFIPLAAPSVLPYDEARHLDPRARAVPLEGGSTYVRTFRDRAAFVLEPHGRALKRLPFGADLSILAALRDGRTALTRGDGGSFVLWRR